MTLQDCYDLLGIDKTYDISVIKKAYRDRAKRFHPDVNNHPDANDIFANITEAYERLLLFIEFREKHGTQIGQRIIEEERNRDAEIMERIEKARKKKQEARDKERDLIQSIYKKYIGSWRIYFSGLFTIIAIPLGGLLFVDYTSEGEIEMHTILSKTIEHKDMIYEDFYITLENGLILAVDPSLCLKSKSGQRILVERTKYFGEITHLTCFERDKTVDYSPISFFNDAWIVLVVLFILPLFSFIFLKPNFVFAFVFVHFNIFIHPLVVLYLLLGDARIIHLIEAFQ